MADRERPRARLEDAGSTARPPHPAEAPETTVGAPSIAEPAPEARSRRTAEEPRTFPSAVHAKGSLARAVAAGARSPEPVTVDPWTAAAGGSRDETEPPRGPRSGLFVDDVKTEVRPAPARSSGDAARAGAAEGERRARRDSRRDLQGPDVVRREAERRLTERREAELRTGRAGGKRRDTGSARPGAPGSLASALGSSTARGTPATTRPQTLLRGSGSGSGSGSGGTSGGRGGRATSVTPRDLPISTPSSLFPSESDLTSPTRPVTPSWVPAVGARGASGAAEEQSDDAPSPPDPADAMTAAEVADAEDAEDAALAEALGGRPPQPSVVVSSSHDPDPDPGAAAGVTRTRRGAPTLVDPLPEHFAPPLAPVPASASPQAPSATPRRPGSTPGAGASTSRAAGPPASAASSPAAPVDDAGALSRRGAPALALAGGATEDGPTTSTSLPEVPAVPASPSPSLPAASPALAAASSRPSPAASTSRPAPSPSPSRPSPSPARPSQSPSSPSPSPSPSSSLSSLSSPSLSSLSSPPLSSPSSPSSGAGAPVAVAPVPRSGGSSAATGRATGLDVAPAPAPTPAPRGPTLEFTRFPLARAGADPRLVLLADPDSPRAAAYRVLRHRLTRIGAPRTLVVTSAHPGEGKTTCAANLALALGECDRARVLLVEANLRSPSLASLFGFQPPVCFAEQIALHRDHPLAAWSVVELGSPSLHVAAVRPSTAPRPLLDGPAFAFAIDALARGGYDHIVLDTPAVLGSADVNLVEDSADGVLLVCRGGRSSQRALARAADQLAPARILGVVLVHD